MAEAGANVRMRGERVADRLREADGEREERKNHYAAFDGVPASRDVHSVTHCFRA